VTKLGNLSGNPAPTREWILGRHSADEFDDLISQRWASDRSRLRIAQ